MTTAKMETAAERYRRIKKEKEAGETLHEVVCAECEMPWKCRKLSMNFWVTSGILPMQLVASMVEATKQAPGAAEDAIRTLATKEIVQSIAFASKAVIHTAVEPKIVENPTEPNEISQEEVMTCCYKTLLDWQMKGGDERAALDTFR